VCTYGRDISEFMITHGGRYSDQKKLSSAVWGLSATARLELLVGWLRGDGHARNPEKYDRVKVEVMGATVSPNLASQLHAVALSIGLRPYYTIRPAGEVAWSNGHVSSSLPCHILSFYGEDAITLGLRMGVSFPTRTKTKVAGFFRNGMYWARVRGVTSSQYKGPVYNIRTSTQEYVAGLVLTHNCFGHWHKDQGVTDLGFRQQVINIGSLTRGSLSQDDLERKPGVALIELAKGQRPVIKVLRLRTAPSDEVFDLDAKVRAEKRTTTVDTFVESIKTKLILSQGDSIEDTVKSLPGVPDKVRERVISYLEKADQR
jgi:hypothetical protein